MSHIGVLALQGAFQKHIDAFARLGIEAQPFRERDELGDLMGLVIPGGESTTIGMLMERRGLVEPVRAAILAGLPVFGTCAGAILLARDIHDSDQLRLGTMDISIQRNFYGSQVDSFEAPLNVEDNELGLKATIDGVFIRAPLITSTGSELVIVAQFEGNPVLVRQGAMLASSFHPELSGSVEIHRYFASLCGLK